MDSERFDRFVKSVSDMTSRRTVVRGATAGAVGGILGLIGLAGQGGLDEADAKSRRNKRRDRRKERQEKKKKRNEECNDKGKVCEAPLNPCERAVCQKHKCVTEVLADGDSCGDGLVCNAGACVCPNGVCVQRVTPDDMSGWQFYNDQDDEPIGPEFSTGPGTPPYGNGSALLQIGGSSEGKLLSTRAFKGTPIGDLQTLAYSTFVTSAGANTAPSFQIGVDRTGTDPFPPEYQGRLVFVPGQSSTQPIDVDEWQNWNLLDPAHGQAWGLTKDFNNVDDDRCRLGTEWCSLEEILGIFPGLRINPTGPSPDNDGAGWGIIGMKVGSGEGAVNANVDAVTVKSTNDSATTVFNFEPSS